MNLTLHISVAVTVAVLSLQLSLLLHQIHMAYSSAPRLILIEPNQSMGHFPQNRSTIDLN